jgi:hypothetical protein
MRAGFVAAGVGLVWALATAAPAAATTATQIAANGQHACAVTGVGGVWCWGSNSQGEYGDGARPFARVAIPVVGFEGGEQIPALGAVGAALLAAALLVSSAGRGFRGSRNDAG